MTSWLFELAVFSWGVVVGFLAALGVLWFARIRSQAARAGESLVRRLGPLEARRFFKAATE